MKTEEELKMYKKEKIAEIKIKWNDYLQFGRKTIQEKLDSSQRERSHFLTLFGSKKQLENITPATYTFVTNLQNDSLCRLFDYGTTSLGETKVNNQNGANRYYFQKQEDGTLIVNKSRAPITIEEGMSEGEMVDTIKPYLLDLFEACNNNNVDKIERNPLRQLLKNKLDFIYRSDKSIPIYVNQHLDKIINYFGIPIPSTKASAFIKREEIYKFYVSLNLPESSPILFMDFLYNSLGYRKLLKPNSTIKLVNGKKNIANDNEADESLYSFPFWEELKKVGEEGERIVLEYLNNHMDELKIDKSKGIIDVRQGQMKGIHCDFVYYTKQGKEIFIEVKATKLNRPNDYHFMMSKAEYDFMCNNKKNYYVYYVNNVFDCDLIEKLTYKMIINQLFTHTYAINSHKI